MRYSTRLAIAVLALVATALPAWSAPLYTVTYNGADAVSSSSELRRDSTFAIYTSNGTGTFTGGGYAGPGHVSARQRLDAQWGGVFSGGNVFNVVSKAQATDFVVSGPPGSVTGTLHLRASADLSLGGGFAGNNAHGTNLYVRADISGYGYNYGSVYGSFYIGNYGPQSSGCLAGLTSPHVDLPFSLTCGIPANAPLNLFLTIEVDGNTYGNINVSPGFVETDAGGDGTDGSGRGVRLDGSGGTVMTLPAGYTLDIPSWGVVNNVDPTLAVGDGAPHGGFGLALASANPTSGASRLTLTLPRGGPVRVVVYDLGGRAVRTLEDGWREAGAHSLAWDGRDATGTETPAGLYFIRADAQGHRSTLRLVRAH
jgi:hypothetical protein